jgi:hypothetical protein
MIRLRFLTSFTVYLLQIRGTISDFGVLIAIIVMVCVDALLGIPTPKLSVPTELPSKASTQTITMMYLPLTL